MRLMVIDMCIDRTLGFLAQLGQKKYTLRVRGQWSVVRRQGSVVKSRNNLQTCR
jgi:hypothetical protein